MALTYLKIFADMEETLSLYSDEERGRLLSAMMAYSFRGEEPEFAGAERFVWPMLRNHIDSCENRSEKMKANGKCGGRPESKPEANESKSNHKKEKEKEIEKDIEKESSPKGEQKKDAPRIMVRPTVEEVSAYCRERGNTVDAQHFVDFYQSKGWKVGTQPKKDWRACVRTWEQREEKPRAGNRFASGLIASDYSGIREEDLIEN